MNEQTLTLARKMVREQRSSERAKREAAKRARAALRAEVERDCGRFFDARRADGRVVTVYVPCK
jgi:hypothetical protein